MYDSHHGITWHVCLLIWHECLLDQVFTGLAGSHRWRFSDSFARWHDGPWLVRMRSACPLTGVWNLVREISPEWKWVWILFSRSINSSLYSACTCRRTARVWSWLTVVLYSLNTSYPQQALDGGPWLCLCLWRACALDAGELIHVYACTSCTDKHSVSGSSCQANTHDTRQYAVI